MKNALKNFLRALIVLIDGGPQRDQFQLEQAHIAGQHLASLDQLLAKRHAACNHRKGGLIRRVKSDTSIAEGLNNGTSASYAVRKHQMMNGDIWVDCIRCGKKWRPPVHQDFNWFERKFRTQRFQNYVAALVEYDTACNFETNNSTSSSILCNFYDRKTGRQANGVIREMYATIGG